MIAEPVVRKSATKWFVSHQDNPEMLLIRTGHHLWTWAKGAKRNKKPAEGLVYEAAWIAVIEAKERFRAPVRAERGKRIEAFMVRRAAQVAKRRANA